MKCIRIIEILILIQIASLPETTEAKPLFLWKKLKKLCGLNGGYGNVFTPFPLITININANLTTSNQSIIFVNTTPNPFVTIIDPRFQIGFRQKINSQGSAQVLTTTQAPIFGSNQNIPETDSYYEYSPAPTFPTYQTTLQPRSIPETNPVAKDKKVRCTTIKPACPSNGYYKTAGASNSQGFLVNGCPCTDFKKINNVLKKVAGK